MTLPFSKSSYQQQAKTMPLDMGVGVPYCYSISLNDLPVLVPRA